ncbi:MAG: PD-(D/E)XK nuclease family protein [Elusimicrobiota bacterium]|nr:PD-(D/E)XK nuclease family protein [Elusimicrobiota bacterium]
MFCPYKYKLIYIDGAETPVTGDISFGHSLHGALEKYHRQENGSFDFLMECYNDAWKSGGFESPLKLFEYYLRGKSMLENYYNSLKQNAGGGKPVYIEEKFEANIGKYRFIGIIDRIDKMSDGSFEIIDYKTHSQIWTQERADRDLQMSFYIHACRTILGINPKTASFYFLSQNKKIQTKRTSADIETAIETALDCAQKINSEDFSPNISNCFRCELKQKCKIRKQDF